MLQVGFNITLDSHYFKQAASKMIVKPTYPEFGIEVRYNNKIGNDFFIICARLINQHKFNYQAVCSARIDKEDKDNQVLDETEIFINLSINHSLTETNIDNIDIKSRLERQMQQQEMKEPGWRFDKINSLII